MSAQLCHEAPISRRPGRPRLADLEHRVLQSALALIDADEEVTVSKLVSTSGVSRAAIYRRWPSLTQLIAAALDEGRVVPPAIEVDKDLRDVFFETWLGPGALEDSGGYSESRFRQRIRLVMADRQLQRTYWETHVSKRRVPIEQALQAGINQGILREDLDVEASFDALAGVAYYQIVVRGDSLSDPAVQKRLERSFQTLWRGMLRSDT